MKSGSPSSFQCRSPTKHDLNKWGINQATPPGTDTVYDYLMYCIDNVCRHQRDEVGKVLRERLVDLQPNFCGSESTCNHNWTQTAPRGGAVRMHATQ